MSKQALWAIFGLFVVLLLAMLAGLCIAAYGVYLQFQADPGKVHRLFFVGTGIVITCGFVMVSIGNWVLRRMRAKGDDSARPN